MESLISAREAAFGLLAIGMAVAPAAASQRVEAKPALILSEQTRGMVTARVGVPVEIRLRGQAGTGFSWVPRRAPSGLTEMKPVKGSRPLPGGAQIQRFLFVAKRAGNYPLSFTYEQPWRGGAKAARTTSFTIIAR